jgi:hypothetical protein
MPIDTRIDVTGLWGAVEGYAITALESPRASITTLSRHFGFDAVETEGVIPLRHARPGLRHHPRAGRSGGHPRGRPAGTDTRSGDRAAAGAEVAGRAGRRGLRRGPRRGATDHRGHDADCLGELPDGGAARGGRAPLPPRVDGGMGGARDCGVPIAALAARARSGRCDPAPARWAAGRPAARLHRRRRGAWHRSGAPGPRDLRSAARRSPRGLNDARWSCSARRTRCCWTCRS